VKQDASPNRDHRHKAGDDEGFECPVGRHDEGKYLCAGQSGLYLPVSLQARYTHPMTDGLILHPDHKTRCWWPGIDPFYVDYHDKEWGVPEFDDRALFEKLILDGFQAGLSWITILRKRENFRRAFAGFEPAVIARFDQAQVEALMLDTGIVRNRAKIEATIAGARAAASHGSCGTSSTGGRSRPMRRPARTCRRKRRFPAGSRRR
jgi:hypothetical protein